MDTLTHRLSVEQAIDRLVDHVQNMDYDELARMLSDRCLDGIVTVADDDCGEESAPFKDGKRMRVTYVQDGGAD